LINIQARLAIHRHHLKNEEANFFNRLAGRNKKEKVDPSGGRMSDSELAQVKINEKLIVSLIEKVIKCENQLVNEEIKTSLVDTHVGITAGLQVDCKAIKYLLKHFTNKVDQLVEQRQLTNPQAANLVPIPFIQELQHAQSKVNVYVPGAVDIYQRQATKRAISPVPQQDIKTQPPY
jgi:hypothetical protein